jgi:hypothetical protein
LGTNLAACISDIAAHLAHSSDSLPYAPTHQMQLVLALEAGQEVPTNV